MSAEYISVAELRWLHSENRKMLLIDVREPVEYRNRHIGNAISIPSEEFENIDYGDTRLLCKLRRYECAGYAIIIYCEAGNTSLICANRLSSCDVTARSLYGGIESYYGANKNET